MTIQVRAISELHPIERAPRNLTRRRDIGLARRLIFGHTRFSASETSELADSFQHGPVFRRLASIRVPPIPIRIAQLCCRFFRTGEELARAEPLMFPRCMSSKPWSTSVRVGKASH